MAQSEDCRAADGVTLLARAAMLGSPIQDGEAGCALMLKPAPTTLKVDPLNHKDAMKDDAEGWTAAEQAELENHSRNGSFTLLDRSQFESEAPGRRLIKLVWVYKRKRDGRLKARLCVQGCSQQPGVDYDQTHCATLCGTSLRMLSAIAGQQGLKMRRWDFVSAFLQAELEEGEVVYCSAPPGPHSTTGKDDHPRVWKVNKPVYGMAQAGRRWQRSLLAWFASYGFQACSADSWIFTLRRAVDTPSGPRDDIVIIGCYVDDLFVLYDNGDEHSLYTQITSDLGKRWDVDDEGEVSDLLNVEISRFDNGVTLRQSAYIVKLASTWLPDGIPSSFHFNAAPHTVLKTLKPEYSKHSLRPNFQTPSCFESIRVSLAHCCVTQQPTRAQILPTQLACCVARWLALAKLCSMRDFGSFAISTATDIYDIAIGT